MTEAWAREWIFIKDVRTMIKLRIIETKIMLSVPRKIAEQPN